MKAFATLGTAVLFLSLGTMVPAFAQEEAKPEQKQQQEHAKPQQEAKPSQQAKPQEQAKPQQQAKPQNENKQQQQAKQQSQQQQAKQQNANKQEQQAKQQSENKQQQQAKQQSENKQQQAKQQSQQKQQQARQQNVQQPVHHTAQQQHVQQAAWQGHRSQNWQSDHRTWQQRGGYNGYRIPDNRYNGYFGASHGFVIFSQPYEVVGGFPRFQYSGYWFSLVDPWPGSWANNWYETDDVYVVYADNGYYMYNQRYPGVGIAISVSL